MGAGDARYGEQLQLFWRLRLLSNTRFSSQNKTKIIFKDIKVRGLAGKKKREQGREANIINMEMSLLCY